MNNDGAAYRRTAKHPGSYSLLRKLRQAGWPRNGDYELACFNCNTGRHINGGICPHKTANPR